MKITIELSPEELCDLTYDQLATKVEILDMLNKVINKIPSSETIILTDNSVNTAVIWVSDIIKCVGEKQEQK